MRADLRRPGAQRTDVLGELQYFSSRIHGVAVGGQGGAELRVAGDRGVPDSVDGGEEVADADGVQPAPLLGGEHPGAQLRVQMPVRISGAGGVVPHRHRLQHPERHLHLPAARADPGSRVPGEPADDLDRGAVLRGVVGGGDVQVHRGGQRPGLGAVDHDFDEPHRTLVGSQPPARLPGVWVPAGDPALVGLPRQRRTLLHPPGGGREAAGQAGALGQVVVISATAVGLQVLPGSRRRTGVDLHPAMHFQCHPTMTNMSPLEMPMGPAKRGPCYPHW